MPSGFYPASEPDDLRFDPRNVSPWLLRNQPSQPSSTVVDGDWGLEGLLPEPLKRLYKNPEVQRKLSELDLASQFMLGPQPLGLMNLSMKAAHGARLRGAKQMVNEAAVAANRSGKSPVVIPENVFFHGSHDIGYDALESGLKGSHGDINTGIGTHFATQPATAEFFVGGPKGGMYLTNLASENPARYYSEKDLTREILAHGMETGELQNSLKRYEYSGNGIGHIVAPEIKQGLQGIRSQRLATMRDYTDELNAYLTTPERNTLAQRHLGWLLDKGYDSVIYGNLGEAPKGNPSIIAFHPDQAKILDRIPTQEFYDGYWNLNKTALPPWYHHIAPFTVRDMPSMANAPAEHFQRFVELMK